MNIRELDESILYIWKSSMVYYCPKIRWDINMHISYFYSRPIAVLESIDKSCYLGLTLISLLTCPLHIVLI